MHALTDVVRCSLLHDVAKQREWQPEILCGAFDKEDHTLYHLFINKVQDNGEVREILTQSTKMDIVLGSNVYRSPSRSKIFDPEHKSVDFTYRAVSKELVAVSTGREYRMKKLKRMEGTRRKENVLFISDIPKVKAWRLGRGDGSKWYMKFNDGSLKKVRGDDPTKAAKWHDVLGRSDETHVLFGEYRTGFTKTRMVIIRTRYTSFASFSILREASREELQGS